MVEKAKSLLSRFYILLIILFLYAPIAVLIILVLFCRGWSSTSRAYGNWVRYWDKGIPPERRDGRSEDR